MHETAALRLDFVPGLPRLLGSTESGELEKRLRDRIELERLRNETDNDLAELKGHAAWLAERFEQPAPDDLDPDWLAEAVKQAQEKEREAAAQFRPVVAALKTVLEPPDDKFEADVQRLLRDGIEVLEGWLAFYQGFHKMLARQAEERRASHKVVRARPVEGEVDHQALSREFMARFPKIRAALAE
jgi:RNase P protein component